MYTHPYPVSSIVVANHCGSLVHIIVQYNAAWCQYSIVSIGVTPEYTWFLLQLALLHQHYSASNYQLECQKIHIRYLVKKNFFHEAHDTWHTLHQRHKYCEQCRCYSIGNLINYYYNLWSCPPLNKKIACNHNSLRLDIATQRSHSTIDINGGLNYFWAGIILIGTIHISSLPNSLVRYRCV